MSGHPILSCTYLPTEGLPIVRLWIASSSLSLKTTRHGEESTENNSSIEYCSKIAKIDLSIAKERLMQINDSHNKLITEIDKIFIKNKKYKESKKDEEKQFYELLINLQIKLKSINKTHQSVD